MGPWHPGPVQKKAYYAYYARLGDPVGNSSIFSQISQVFRKIQKIGFRDYLKLTRLDIKLNKFSNVSKFLPICWPGSNFSMSSSP